MDVFADHGDGKRQLLGSGLTASETNELIEWWSHIKPVGMAAQILVTADDHQDWHMTVSGLHEEIVTCAKKSIATAGDRWQSL